MGCNGSKATAAPAQNVTTEDASKTLLVPAPAKAAEGVAATPNVRVPLKVTVISAKNLRNADCVLAGKSDPYCTCEVTGKADSQVSTDSVTNQLNPEWNHECGTISSYCIGDSLTFVVKDKDPLKPDDILGKFVLQSEKLFPNGCEEEVALVETGDNKEAFLKFKVVVMHPKVRVTITSASNLRNADWVGKSDPYCICEVEDKAGCKTQTPNVDENLNPQWNHAAEMVGFHAGDALTFTVKDKDPVKPDDILGRITVPYEKFGEVGFEGELTLEGCSAEAPSQLKVKVTVNAPDPVAEQEAAEVKEEKATENAAVAEARPEEKAADTVKEKIVEESPAISKANPADFVVEEHVSAGKSCFC